VGLALNLSPHTWGGMDDVPAGLWETFDINGVLVDSGS
jgi:hypothetical protein